MSDKSLFDVPLYKLMERRFAKELVRNGRIRIGTLYDYRNQERHVQGVVDQQEGWKAIWSTDDLHADDPSGTPEFTKNVVKITGEGSSMINCKVTQRIQSDDVFVCSLSAARDVSVMECFPSYNTVVEISHPGLFVQIITSELCRRCAVRSQVILQPCQYRAREVHYQSDNGVHPALLKSVEFAAQKEVRAVWEPIRQPIDPTILTCPKLTRICKIVSLP